MAAAAAAAKKAPRLVTIRFSHYNEQARWALDYFGLPYVERHYLPGFATLGVIAHGGWRGEADRSSSRFSTPLLVLPDGAHIHDSRLIIKHCDAVGPSPGGGGPPPLLPTPAVERDVEHFHDFLGPHTRRVSYFHLFQERELFLDTCARNGGPAQAALMRALLPLVRRYMGRMAITPERTAKSRGYVDKEFDAVAERLARGGSDFLHAGRFTAADLSFAALASPVLFPRPWEGFGGYLPPVETLPDELRATVRAYRAHPAGQHAMRMFRWHRGRRVLPAWPHITQTPPHDVGGGPDERPGAGNLGPGVE